MAKRPRRNHDQNFKTRVVLEALKEQKTLSQLSTQFELHANQITDWKKQVVSAMPTLFEGKNQRQNTDLNPEQIELITAPLYQQIGQLKVELDFLKKKLAKPS
jgi:putative transposase